MNMKKKEIFILVIDSVDLLERRMPVSSYASAINIVFSMQAHIYKPCI